MVLSGTLHCNRCGFCLEGIIIKYLAERYPKDLWKGARGRMSRQREAAAPCNAAIVRGFRCLWGAFWVVFRCVLGAFGVVLGAFWAVFRWF